MLSLREVMFILWPMFAILKLMAKVTVKVAIWSGKALVGGVRWIANRVAGSNTARGELGDGN